MVLIRNGTDSKGGFFQAGKGGTRFHYPSGNKALRAAAKARAEKQARGRGVPRTTNRQVARLRKRIAAKDRQPKAMIKKKQGYVAHPRKHHRRANLRKRVHQAVLNRPTMRTARRVRVQPGKAVSKGTLKLIKVPGFDKPLPFIVIPGKDPIPATPEQLLEYSPAKGEATMLQRYQPGQARQIKHAEQSAVEFVQALDPEAAKRVVKLGKAKTKIKKQISHFKKEIKMEDVIKTKKRNQELFAECERLGAIIDNLREQRDELEKQVGELDVLEDEAAKETRQFFTTYSNIRNKNSTKAKAVKNQMKRVEKQQQQYNRDKEELTNQLNDVIAEIGSYQKEFNRKCSGKGAGRVRGRGYRIPCKGGTLVINYKGGKQKNKVHTSVRAPDIELKYIKKGKTRNGRVYTRTIAIPFPKIAGGYGEREK